VIQTELDKTKIRHSFAAAAASYDRVAALQRQVGREVLQRFPVAPGGGVLLDLGSGTGFLSAQIKQFGVVDNVVAIDLALPMLEISRRNHQALAIQHLCADAQQLPLRGGALGQIYSNLALQWLQDLPLVFGELKRVLQPDGQLVFATFGPQTLKELKLAWAAVDDAVHVNDFNGSEAIERALNLAGFGSLQLATTIHRCRYPSVMTLMRELKALGAHNINNGRKRKPTTKAELQRMIEHYQQQMEGQVIEASYEIIMVRAVA
jgi:malonyl-CoA O-methyltransferase